MKQNYSIYFKENYYNIVIHVNQYYIIIKSIFHVCPYFSFAEINFEIPLKKDIWTLGLTGWVAGDWTSFKRIWDFELDMIVTWT